MKKYNNDNMNDLFMEIISSEGTFLYKYILSPSIYVKEGSFTQYLNNKKF